MTECSPPYSKNDWLPSSTSKIEPWTTLNPSNMRSKKTIRQKNLDLSTIGPKHLLTPRLSFDLSSGTFITSKLESISDEASNSLITQVWTCLLGARTNHQTCCSSEGAFQEANSKWRCGKPNSEINRDSQPPQPPQHHAHVWLFLRLKKNIHHHGVCPCWLALCSTQKRRKV